MILVAETLMRPRCYAQYAMTRIVPVLMGVGIAAALTLGGGPSARADAAADHYTQALQLKRQGKIPEAIRAAEQAIAARSDFAAAHFTLGNLWRQQGNY